MGFKIRLGMAGIGLVMSYFFGLSGLSGIASHLDSTGNVLVDIADGIGLVSKVIHLLTVFDGFLTVFVRIQNLGSFSRSDSQVIRPQICIIIMIGYLSI